MVDEGHPAEVAAVVARAGSEKKGSRRLLVPDSPFGVIPKQLFDDDPKVVDSYLDVPNLPNLQQINTDLKSKVLGLQEGKVADSKKWNLLSEGFLKSLNLRSSSF